MGWDHSELREEKQRDHDWNLRVDLRLGVLDRAYNIGTDISEEVKTDDHPTRHCTPGSRLLEGRGGGPRTTGEGGLT